MRPTDPPNPFQHPRPAAAWRFFARAMRLRCPECGTSPVFRPLRQTRSWHDWATPLERCPRCDYAYEREPGYFLPAIWVVHVFSVFALGLVVGLLLDAFTDLSLTATFPMACAPMVAFAIGFIRHAKAIYLAFDHVIDPQAKRNRRGTEETRSWTGELSRP